MFESTDDNCLAALGNAAGPTFTCSLVQCINAGWSHCFRRQLLTCSAFTVVCRKWVFMGKISQHDGQRGNASNGRNNRKLDSIKLSVWWPLHMKKSGKINSLTVCSYNLLISAYLTRHLQGFPEGKVVVFSVFKKFSQFIVHMGFVWANFQRLHNKERKVCTVELWTTAHISKNQLVSARFYKRFLFFYFVKM